MTIHYNLLPNEYEDIHPEIFNIFGEKLVLSLFENSFVDFYSKVIIDNFYGKINFSKYIDDRNVDFCLEYIPSKNKVKLTWVDCNKKVVLFKRRNDKQFTQYEIDLHKH